MPCHERHPCSPARLYGQKEETGGHVELLLPKIPVEMSGRFSPNLLNASVGTRVNLVMAASALSLWKNLTHGGRIVLWIPRIFPVKFWKACESHYHLISMKIGWPWTLSNGLRQESGSCCNDCWIALHQRTASRNPSQGVHLVYLTLHVGLEPLDLSLLTIWTNMNVILNSTSSEAGAATLRLVKENGRSRHRCWNHFDSHTGNHRFQV